MKAQLDRLLALMGLPGLSLGIVPRAAATQIWLGHGFSMFDDKLVLWKPTRPSSPSPNPAKSTCTPRPSPS